MEILIEIVIEVFGEIILQVVLQCLAEAGLHFVQKPSRESEARSQWLLTLGYALFGSIVGGLSLLLFSHSLMHSTLGRLASLALTPIVAGLTMSRLGAWRQRRGQQRLTIDRFAYGYLFALAVALI